MNLEKYNDTIYLYDLAQVYFWTRFPEKTGKRTFDKTVKLLISFSQNIFYKIKTNINYLKSESLLQAKLILMVPLV